MASTGQVAYFVGQDGDSSYVDKLLKQKVLDCLKL